MFMGIVSGIRHKLPIFYSTYITSDVWWLEYVNMFMHPRYLDYIDAKPIFWVINGQRDRLARGNIFFGAHTLDCK